MTIGHYEADLDKVLDLHATGLKVGKGDKIIKTEHFVDIVKNKVLFRVYIQQAGEDEAKPLIVLPNQN